MASRGSPRGVLRLGSGVAHTPGSLSKIVRVKEKLVAEAWARLTSLGWLELCGRARKRRASSAHDARHRGEKRRGDERTEEKKRLSTSPHPPGPAGNSDSTEGVDARPGKGTASKGVTCRICTDGAILVDGKIVRCCGCPRGTARAKALRASKRAEGRETAAKAGRGPDEPREAGGGPASTSGGPGLIRGPDLETIVDPDTGRSIPPRGRKK